MSAGPIKVWRNAHKPTRVSTSDSARVCFKKLNQTRAACGRKPSVSIDTWEKVTCADCRAAREADREAALRLVEDVPVEVHEGTKRGTVRIADRAAIRVRAARATQPVAPERSSAEPQIPSSRPRVTQFDRHRPRIDHNAVCSDLLRRISTLKLTEELKNLIHIRTLPAANA